MTASASPSGSGTGQASSAGLDMANPGVARCGCRRIAGRTPLSRGNAESQLETPLGIGLRPADGSVFLAVEGIDGPPPGESHAIGPDGEYRGILHRLPEMVEDAPADSSPLLQPNHRLDSVFSGGGSLAENRLGYVAVRENARRPAFVPPDRRSEIDPTCCAFR